MISQQASNKKPRLASFTARPCDVTCCTSFLGPVSQNLIPAFVIQAIFPSRVTLVPSSGAKTLFFVIIYRQPSNRNSIFRNLALVVVNIQKRHCKNKHICGQTADQVNNLRFFKRNTPKYSKIRKCMHKYTEILQISTQTCTYCRLGNAYDEARKKTCQHKKVASK